jgi:ABC-type transport system substrate-binding protein
MWGAEPDSLDPALAYNSRGSWMLLYATCAKLFNTVQDPRSDETRVVPEVVRSYKVSADGRTWTFDLKRTFRFHTGAPVTARSFADAFNRTANPATNSPAVRRGFLEEIVGSAAVTEGRAQSLSGVRVLDRYRLRIRLKRPAGDFVARLTMPFFCPLLPGTPISPAGIDNPPGSGPYYIADRVPQRRIVLERNPYYRGRRTANPDRIVWTINTDHAERIRATEQDRNDFTPVFGYPDALVRDLTDRYGLNRAGGRFFRLPTSSNFLFVFNPYRGALKGVDQAPLRKAINYVLDRPALTATHGKWGGKRTDRLLPTPLSKSRRVYPIRGPDPETARKWLARAARRPQTLTLYTANFQFSILNAQVFASNLKQLGIEVVPKHFSFETLVEKLRTPGEPWDVAWLPWGATYPDPVGALLPLLRGTRYEPRVLAVNRLRGAARAKAWADLETKLMRDDPPVAAYADSNSLILVSGKVGCYRWLSGGEIDLAAVCKK